MSGRFFCAILWAETRKRHATWGGVEQLTVEAKGSRRQHLAFPTVPLRDLVYVPWPGPVMRKWQLCLDLLCLARLKFAARAKHIRCTVVRNEALASVSARCSCRSNPISLR